MKSCSRCAFEQCLLLLVLLHWQHCATQIFLFDNRQLAALIYSESKVSQLQCVKKKQAARYSTSGTVIIHQKVYFFSLYKIPFRLFPAEKWKRMQLPFVLIVALQKSSQMDLCHLIHSKEFFFLLHHQQLFLQLSGCKFFNKLI